MAVALDQRFRRAGDCPICEGGDSVKRRRGERCAGFLSSDERYAFCTREEYAGGLPIRATSPASYMHKLDGPCDCGEDHADAYRVKPFRQQSAPATPKKITRIHTWRSPERVHQYDEHLRLLRWGRGKDKTLCWQHFDGHDWADGQGGYTPGVYQPVKIATAAAWQLVFVVEGEGKVDAIVAAGGVALCNPGGAGAWRDEYAADLTGRHVVVLTDADKAGRDHVATVVPSVATVAASVRLLEIEGAHDVEDWLNDGHTLAELCQIAATTPTWEREIQNEFHDTSPAYETLLAQNRSMNDKLLWIYEVIGGRRLTHAQKCALIMVRKNSEWSVNQPWPKESEESAKMRAQGFTPDTLGSLARDIGASEKSTHTVSKYLQVLKDEKLIAIEPFREINENEAVPIPRLAYATLPKASQPKAYAQAKEETRGGVRENAGRPKKCATPGCGSEEFGPETTHRELHEVIVRTAICKKCGKPHREVVRDEMVGREQIAENEDVKSNIDFTSSDDEIKHEGNDTSLPSLHTPQTLQSPEIMRPHEEMS